MPRLPPRQCTSPFCPNYATKRGRCDEHQPEEGWSRWAKKQGTTSQRGYGKPWERQRKKALYRDSYLCQECMRNGVYRAGNEVDHIKPKSQGGTDELDNLQTLCKNCHMKKTLDERKPKYDNP